jgi:hypothetical protein
MFFQSDSRKKRDYKRTVIGDGHNAAGLQQLRAVGLAGARSFGWETRSWLRHYATSWKVAGSRPD